MSLITKFSLYICTIIFFILALVSIIMGINRVSEIEKQLIQKDKIVSVNLSRTIYENLISYYFSDYELFKTQINKYFERYPDLERIIIVNPDKKILFDSLELIQGRAPDTEIRNITEPDVIQKITQLQTNAQITVYDNKKAVKIFAPYLDKPGFIHRTTGIFTFSLDRVEAAQRESIFFFISAFFIFLALGTAITILFIQRIIKPINDLIKGAEAVSKGDLTKKIKNTSSDEIGKLAMSFNKMTDDLRIARGIIKKNNQNLEDKVANRTKELSVSKRELEDKLQELQRINKFTIDRELEMVKLKNEIKELKEILKIKK